jgi:hypothetical protein
MSKSHPSTTPAEPAPQAVPIRSIEGATEPRVGQSLPSLRDCLACMGTGRDEAECDRIIRLMGGEMPMGLAAPCPVCLGSGRKAEGR